MNVVALLMVFQVDTSFIDFLLPFFRWFSGIVSFESLQLNYYIADRLFPMNSGDLGFYLGIMLGLLTYPLVRDQVHRHYDLKWYALAALPFVGYWLLVIRVQRLLYGLERVERWTIPPSKELYTLLGISCGMAAVFYVLYHLSEHYYKPDSMISWLRRWNLIALVLMAFPTVLTFLFDGTLSSLIFVFLGMISSLGVFSFLILVTLYFGELMADVFVGMPRQQKRSS